MSAKANAPAEELKYDQHGVVNLLQVLGNLFRHRLGILPFIQILQLADRGPRHLVAIVKRGQHGGAEGNCLLADVAASRAVHPEQLAQFSPVRLRGVVLFVELRVRTTIRVGNIVFEVDTLNIKHARKSIGSCSCGS